MNINWVPRASWQAARAVGSENPVPQHVYGLAVHYEGVDVGGRAHTTCATHVRGIQRYHQGTKGFADIAYNFLICRHGYVFVGRGTSAGSAAQGTDSGNRHWWAVCFLNGPHDAFSAAQDSSFTQLRTYLMQRGTGGKVQPHSYFTSTLCPGKVIGKYLELRWPSRP